jgi:hypothetical protein
MSRAPLSFERIKKNIISYVEKGQNTVEKGNLFLKWVMKYVFEQSDEEMDESIAIGGKNDNSIDASFEENKILYIIQTKYNQAHTWAGVTNFSTDIQRLIKAPNAIVGESQLVYEVAEMMREYQEEGKLIEVYYITDKEFSNDEKQKIEKEIERFENVFENINLYVWDINAIKDYFDMSLNVIPKIHQGKKAQITLKKYFVSDITCVAEVELKHLAHFIKQNKDYLFCSNIRNYLKNTPVNKEIVETFCRNPEDIWYFNNGITMVCDDFDVKDEYFLHLTTPQIVNGCQTANTILKEFINLKDKEKQNNLQGTILIKVIKDEDEKKKDQITKYTNRQNAVSGKDFFALEKFHRQLSCEFDELGYFYEIQNKSSWAKTSRDMVKYRGIRVYQYLFSKKFNNILPVKTVVQAYAAGMHFLPGTAASRSGELMVYGKKWSLIFNDSTPEDPHLWLYPFAIMVYAKNILGYNNRSEIHFKRNSLMFFVSCYFRVLCHLYNKIDLLSLSEGIAPLKISKEVYKTIFDNQDINIKLLKLTDSIVRFFMKDGLIKDIIKKKYDREDLINFMKSEIETNETVKNRLEEIICDFLSEDPSLVKEFSTLLQKCSTFDPPKGRGTGEIA